MEPIKSTHKRKLFYKNAYLYFVLAFIVVLIGFYKSFLSSAAHNDRTHTLHGIAASAWMLLLIIQPLLYSFKQWKWHRWLGKFSLVLVPFLILSGIKMIQAMILDKANYPPEVVYQLSFLDMFSLLQFILFFSMALKTVKQVQEHARYMAATVFIFIVPGLGRLMLLFPAVTSFTIALNLTYVLVEAALVILIFDDKRSGRIRTAYPLSLCLFAFQHILLNYVAGWPFWHNWMDRFASLPF